MMYLVSSCTMSPAWVIRNPRGNRAFGRSAAFLLLADFFLSINPFLLRTLPTVLTETVMFSLRSNARSLCLDHAGYCCLNSTVLLTTSHGVVGILRFLGRLDLSLKPVIPCLENLCSHRYRVILPIPKCLAVREAFFPCAL